MIKIYIDRLQEGKEHRFDEEFPSTFMNAEEEGLAFPHPVLVKGKAYVASDHLIIQLSASVEATMPCKMCNAATPVSLKVENLTQAIPLTEIKGAIFSDFAFLRDALLLELPHFVECSGGRCKEREQNAPYLKKGNSDVHFPFAEL